MFLRVLLPASLLAGTIIGAGMFALPFVFQSAGLLTGFIYLFLFAAIFILIYFLYADLISKTAGEEHRFLGYCRLHLGKGGFWAAFLIGLIEWFFVLTIYLILAPSFSKLFIGGDYFYHLLVFWLLGSIAILFKVKRVAFLETLIVGGMAILIILIFGKGIGGFSLPIGWGKIDLTGIFTVAGPIFFALSGALAIPETVSYFRQTRIPFSYLRKALVLGGVLPAVAYGMFVVGILGLSKNVSQDAVSGLIGQVPPVFLGLIGILGILSLFSSYIVVGLNERRMLQLDLGIPAGISGFLVVCVPLIIYLLGFQDFLSLVSFMGIIFLPLEVILILLMWLKAHKIG